MSGEQREIRIVERRELKLARARLAAINAKLARAGVGPGGVGVRALVAEVERLRQELADLNGARLLSILFGHHEGAPRPFALQRKDRSLVALGAEFPDGAVALRLANDGGWTTKSEGGVDALAIDGMEILWLSDEIEPLAEMEQRTERVEAERDRMRPVVEAAVAWNQSGGGGQSRDAWSPTAAENALEDAVEAYQATPSTSVSTSP